MISCVIRCFDERTLKIRKQLIFILISKQLIILVIVKMAVACSKSVKILQITQNYLAILGIESQQSIQQRPFNEENLKTLAVFSFTTISSIIYFCRAPNDFMEYNQSLCFTATVGNTMLLLALVIWKQPEIFEFIKNFEIIVNESELKLNCNFFFFQIKSHCKFFIKGLQKSESKAIFHKTNQQVEILSETIFYILMKVLVPCFVLPKFIISFYIYFIAITTTKSGNVALELPIPMW